MLKIDLFSPYSDVVVPSRGEKKRMASTSIDHDEDRSFNITHHNKQRLKERSDSIKLPSLGKNPN
jgi:hypothetical protein